jgi:hypothetical protein
VSAFSTLARKLPGLLGQQCGFVDTSYDYMPIPSLTNPSSYDLYTIIPLTMATVIDTDEPSQELADMVLDKLDTQCSREHIERIVVKANELLPPDLQLDHIMSDIEVFNAGCVYMADDGVEMFLKQIKKAKKHRVGEGGTGEEKKQGELSNPLSRVKNGHNTGVYNSEKIPIFPPPIPVASQTSIPDGEIRAYNIDDIKPSDKPQFSRDFDLAISEHFFYGEFCPKRPELTPCTHTNQCQSAAGSVCKPHFNRKLKKNLDYCSLVNKWRDPTMTHLVLGSILIALTVIWVKTIADYQMGKRIADLIFGTAVMGGRDGNRYSNGGSGDNGNFGQINQFNHNGSGDIKEIYGLETFSEKQKKLTKIQQRLAERISMEKHEKHETIGKFDHNNSIQNNNKIDFFLFFEKCFETKPFFELFTNFGSILVNFLDLIYTDCFMPCINGIIRTLDGIFDSKIGELIGLNEINNGIDNNNKNCDKNNKKNLKSVNFREIYSINDQDEGSIAINMDQIQDRINSNRDRGLSHKVYSDKIQNCQTNDKNDDKNEQHNNNSGNIIQEDIIDAPTFFISNEPSNSPLQQHHGKGGGGNKQN